MLPTFSKHPACFVQSQPLHDNFAFTAKVQLPSMSSFNVVIKSDDKFFLAFISSKNSLYRIK
uniref:Uncharacterized protein n=1 Tax=Octopus bimaculoides TaxID=37653 RepID=A0A0L8HRI6_OCTBM